MNNSINKNIEITDKNVGKKETHAGLRKRHNNAINFLMSMKLDKNSKILDIGCREGLFLERMQLHGFSSLWGVDISSKSIKYLNKKRKNINGVVGNAQSIPFLDKSFDVIICTHTLEHCENPDKVISEIYRLLKPNGICLIEVPIENVDSPRVSVGHFSAFRSENDLKKSIKNNNINILQSEKDPHPKKHWFRVIGAKNE